MRLAVTTLSVLLLCSACSRDFLYEDTLIASQKAAVVEATDETAYETLLPSRESLRHLAADYHAKPGASLKMTAIYDPVKDPHFCDKRKIATLKWRLAQEGITNVEIEELPVARVRPQLLAEITAPELVEAAECVGQTMPGRNAGTHNVRDYVLGCSLQRQIMAQIADPRYAMGRAGLGGVSSGERAANVIEGRDGHGDPLSYAPGYTISDSVQESD
tara:strand:+ start:282 stop:932 length:651 start_codon:yes stop_codon:yes gene_type:complete